MYSIIMYIYVVTYAFGTWFFRGFIPMLIFFIPVLPIMLLAFPMIFLDDKHWTCKPYLWYFKKVWLKVVGFTFKTKLADGVAN